MASLMAELGLPDDDTKSDAPQEADKPASETPKVEAEPEAKEDAQSDDDADEDGDEGEPEQDAPKKLSRHRRQRNEIERLRAELEASKARNGAPMADTVEAELERRGVKKPAEEDFEGDLLAFDRAMTSYEVRKAALEDRMSEHRESLTRQQQIELATLKAELRLKVDEAKRLLPDWDSVFAKANASRVEPKPEIADAILRSENSAVLAYHLAKNSELIGELNGLPLTRALMRLGEISAKVSLPRVKTTAAPTPKGPLKGGAAPARHPNDMSVDELAKELGLD